MDEIVSINAEIPGYESKKLDLYDRFQEIKQNLQKRAQIFEKMLHKLSVSKERWENFDFSKIQVEKLVDFKEEDKTIIAEMKEYFESTRLEQLKNLDKLVAGEDSLKLLLLKQKALLASLESKISEVVIEIYDKKGA